MKKTFLFLLLSLLLFNVSFAYTLADYFPLNKGAHWEYQMSEAKSEVNITEAFDAYGFKVSDFEEKWFLSNGEIISEFINSYSHDVNDTRDRIILARTITKNQFVGEKIDEPDPVLVILNSPIKVGNKWLVGIDERDGTETYRKIVGIGPIKTPAGTFDQAIKVRETIYVGGNRKVKYNAQGEKVNPMEFYYWYAPNVGLVKDPLKGELVVYNVPSTNENQY